jgi:hypothetical protein
MKGVFTNSQRATRKIAMQITGDDRPRRHLQLVAFAASRLRLMRREGCRPFTSEAAQFVALHAIKLHAARGSYQRFSSDAALELHDASRAIWNATHPRGTA